MLCRAPPGAEVGEQEAGAAWEGQGPGGRPDRHPPHALHHPLRRLLHEPAGAPSHCSASMQQLCLRWNASVGAKRCRDICGNLWHLDPLFARACPHALAAIPA